MSIRKNATVKIRDIIAQFAPDDYDIDARAKRIEKECNNRTVLMAQNLNIKCSYKSPDFVAHYDSQIQMILHNMENNEELVQRIIEDIEMPVGNKSAAELCPEANRHIYEEIAQKNQQKIEHKSTSAYKCRKCGKRKATIRIYQARSGDEGATVKIECLVCGAAWNA